MYKVISITTLFGEKLPIDKMEFLHIGADYAIGHFKGYGFDGLYSKADGYTVITEKVDA